MKQRIARTIVGVTAFVVVLLGVPLAVAVQRFYESRATVQLQRSAAQVVAEMAVPLEATTIAAIADEPDVPADFSVYDADGARLYGTGPELLGDDEPDELVVTSPVTDRSAEDPVGFVRVARPSGSIDSEVRRAWALMSIAAAVGLAVAWALARREADRLSAPISDLADRAQRLGAGEFDVTSASTSIPELDAVADALATSSVQLAEMVARERAFSSNASHQLRTPLTALRVSLDRGDLDGARVEADRLTATVEHMLGLARDALPVAEPTDVGDLVRAAVERWRDVLGAAGRPIELAVDTGVPPVRVRPTSLEQVLDVLLDNSVRHGDGPVHVAVRSVAGGLVVQVDDGGSGIGDAVAETLFERHEGDHHGIGLALARTLVEADGGRLLLADRATAEFRIVFAADSGPEG